MCKERDLKHGLRVRDQEFFSINCRETEIRAIHKSASGNGKER